MQDAIQHGRMGPLRQSTRVVPGQVGRPPLPPNVGPKRPLEPVWSGLATSSSPAQQAHNDMPESSSAPRTLKPGQTFLSNKRQLRAQQAPASEIAHGISPDLTPAEVSWIVKNYKKRDQKEWTLMERRWLERLHQHAIEGGYINKDGQVMPERLALQPQQQLHEARPIPLSSLGEQHPLHGLASGSYAHKNDDLEAMQAYRRRRLTLSIDSKFVPPEPGKLTKLQRIISSFKLPYESGVGHWPLGARRFSGATRFRDGGIARVATEPDLISKLSLVHLSNQQLTGEAGTWEALGARLIFAQDYDTAYAIVDGQLLKKAAPNMLEEDKQKLQNGRVAIIKIDKMGKRYAYRLFSVLKPEVIEHLEP